MGYVYSAGGAAISWSSNKQKTVALSTMESELYALTEASRHAYLVNSLGKDILRTAGMGLILNCDNQAAIAVATNAEHYSARTKHISVREMKVKEIVEQGVIKLNYVNSEDNVADILTKPLKEGAFVKLRAALGVVE